MYLTIDGTVHNSYSDQALLFDKETLQSKSGPTLPSTHCSMANA